MDTAWRANATSLRRAVLVKTEGAAAVLFAPDLEPVQVSMPDEWRMALAAGRRVPVAYDAADPTAYWLLDHPAQRITPVVPGVELPAPERPMTLPGPVELDCPAPAVADYLALLEAGKPSRLADHPVGNLMQAFALRVEQLSRHELERIAALARVQLTDSLLERVTRAGPGMELYAEIDEAFRRFHDHGDPWPGRVVRASYCALLHSPDVPSQVPGDTPRVLAKMIDTLTASSPAPSADVSTMLRPWVSVCGPVPGYDVPPLEDADAPYAVREGDVLGSRPTPRPSRPAPPREPIRSRSGRPDLGPPPSARPAPAPRQGRWARRRAEKLAAANTTAASKVMWDSAITRHDEILKAYVAYEMDPQLILAYPAVLDIQVTQTQAFHDANAKASALRTDSGPADAAHANAYLAAVTALDRAWQTAERHGRQVGHSYLRREDARDFGRAAGLLRHAAATDGAERESYRRAAGELLKTQLSGRVTQRASYTLERAVRGELEA